MVALGQAVTVDLEPMAQPGLDDAVIALDRREQAMHVGDQIVFDPVEILGDDRAEQEATEARSRIDGKHQMPQREPARRLCGPGVPDLDLGQQHGGQT